MKTKIYGTIGPACSDTDTLALLFESGMSGIRLNLSHSSLDEAAGWIANIQAGYQKCRKKSGKESQDGERKAAPPEGSMSKSDQTVPGPEIVMDLQGPELRIGKFTSERMLEPGNRILLQAADEGTGPDDSVIPIPAFVLSHIRPGQEILLDDGKFLLKAEKTPAGSCRIERGGRLRGGKSIALPGIALHPPTLTGSDLENIAAAHKYGVTGVMLPFVRGTEDLLHLKAALAAAEAPSIRIFAKIENLAGVKKLPELLSCCDEIVIARGDLGNAIPLWKLPVIQKQIADCCKRAGKPFMVVTQMLASMEYSKVPTRAEVSDIFLAVAEGASSVMLTGETAAGAYPLEAMKYLVNTVREAEAELHDQ